MNRRILPGLVLGLVFLLASALPAAPAAAQFTDFEAAIAAFDAEVAAAVAEDAGGCVSVAVFVGDEVGHRRWHHGDRAFDVCQPGQEIVIQPQGSLHRGLQHAQRFAHLG